MFNLIGKAYAILLPTLSPLTAGTLTGTIQNIITWVLFLAGALAIIYLIYGGLLYITAAGDAEKATKGRTALINAIIGIVIIALSYVIVTWVVSIITSGTA